MSWIGRSIGEFGSEIGQARDISLDWRQRQQNLAFEAARQKIAQLMGPLQLQELQQKIKQMGQPQAAGVEKLPGGGLGGVTFKDGAYSLQNLAPGAPPEPKFPTLQAAAAYYLQKGDFEKLKTVNDEIDRTKNQPKPEIGYADVSTDTKGNKWGFNKATNKFEMIPVPKGVQFPVPREPADPNAAFDRWQKEQEYKAAHPSGLPKELQSQTDKLQKIVSQLSGIQGMSFKSLSPDDSVSLAKAADDVTGGTSRTSELKARGGKGLMGYRWYSPTSFNESEAKSIYRTMAGVLNAQINALRKQYEKAKIDPPDWLQPIPPTTGERLK